MFSKSIFTLASLLTLASGESAFAGDRLTSTPSDSSSLQSAQLAKGLQQAGRSAEAEAQSLLDTFDRGDTYVFNPQGNIQVETLGGWRTVKRVTAEGAEGCWLNVDAVRQIVDDQGDSVSKTVKMHRSETGGGNVACFGDGTGCLVVLPEPHTH